MFAKILLFKYPGQRKDTSPSSTASRHFMHLRRTEQETFLSYFEKNSSYIRGLSVCIFVALRVLFQDISDLLRLSRTVQRTNFIVYEFCFTCFKVGYKRSYIFQSSSIETIIDIQIMDFNSKA